MTREQEMSKAKLLAERKSWSRRGWEPRSEVHREAAPTVSAESDALRTDHPG